jgi:hypothetical protein
MVCITIASFTFFGSQKVTLPFDFHKDGVNRWSGWFLNGLTPAVDL